MDEISQLQQFNRIAPAEIDGIDCSDIWFNETRYSAMARPKED